MMNKPYAFPEEIAEAEELGMTLEEYFEYTKEQMEDLEQTFSSLREW